MNITKVNTGREPVVVVTGSEVLIKDVQSALDLMATVRYETGVDRIVLSKSLVDESFFDLKTRLAGEVLQKFINYQVKAAFVGDFSVYSSKSFRDFVYECNKGKDFFFLSDEQEAVEKLSQL